MNRILKNINCEDSLWAPLMAATFNVAVLFVVAFIARAEFFVKNYEFFPSIRSLGDFIRVALAGIRFDTPGILYLNLPYIFLMLLPLHIKERHGYYLACKWIFIILNSLGLIANLADSVYYPFTMRRTAWDILSEFSNESNAAAVVGVEMWHNWWVVLLAILLIWGMWKIYVSPPGSSQGGWRYYAVMLASMAIAAPICVGGIRGGWLCHWQNYILALPCLYAAWRLRNSHRNLTIGLTGAAVALLVMAPIGGWRHRDIRPIALSNANAYARHPSETALILNTPFSLLRTISSNPFPVTQYFTDADEMRSLYSTLHKAPALVATDSARNMSGDMIKKNVVVIILESFGEEYIDALNDRALGADSPGYAPFMDSLASKSLRFTHSYDNGSKSIDAMPSVLASIPRFARPFILTSSAVEPIPGLPALLGRQGYSTAFFHGARTGSMGFDGFARLVGFDRYYGREDFEAYGRCGGAEEFDGYWAIWDEPFFQYYATVMSELPQPFMTAIFSATSHHPFHVPAKYAGKFPKGTLPIHQCIGYTDLALRRFFETAEKTDWYKNTIFVITNDHTNQRAYPEYRSDIGVFYGPLLIFDPSGEIVGSELRDGIISQIDVMPTILGLLNYPEDYSAYGMDMSRRGAKGQAVSYINNQYQYVEGAYILQFDGERSVALFEISDHLQKHNLLTGSPEERKKALRIAEPMEKRLKALIQTYMMNRGRI
ncbi:MAG: LTA synthase family protein [Muribaculaceae bacterium]|nr:LTA synthase family protein [Muribaculaceae bacterium]